MKYCNYEQRDFPDDEFRAVGGPPQWLHLREPMHTIDGSPVPGPDDGIVHIPVPPAAIGKTRLPVPNRVRVSVEDIPDEVKEMLPPPSSAP